MTVDECKDYLEEDTSIEFYFNGKILTLFIFNGRNCVKIFIILNKFNCWRSVAYS